VADLGDRNTLILRNHGLLVCGRSVGETYVNLWCLEVACRMQIQTLSCGQELNKVSDFALKNSEDIYEKMRRSNMKNYVTGDLEWAAARRVLDRVTTDYMN
jgi:ribulose-5-phosphate 4-epimerase/fuculose-1-phosphate aldolase